MKNWSVNVTVELPDGYTAEDAEIDSGNAKTHQYLITAETEEQAIESALDIFHSTIPIGVLDNVDIETSARTIWT